MTQHWEDFKNADVILLMGSNAAENHPMAFKWIEEARKKGGKLINVDPRFCRSSSKADIYAPMRSGTDIAFFGGMIKYAIDHGLYNEKYVRECTNALLKVNTGFETCAEGTSGVFSGTWETPPTWNDTLQADVDAKYDKTTWNYGNTSVPEVAADLNDPDCVFQKLKKQFENYTIENVCAITGTPAVLYEQICEAFCSTYPDDKSATILYAMGTTQHTIGTQNIRGYAILQLLLGNIGVAGGGINALRGQCNVQGSTDMCILNHILPGYLKVPTPAQTTLALYNEANYNSAQAANPVHSYTVRGNSGVDPASAHWWQNGTKYIASLLKAWWPTQTLDTGYSYLSKKTADYSMLSIFDAMHNDLLAGFICDGENPAVTDPDSNHVREALGHLDWMVCIDPFETETAAFWKRPGVDPTAIGTTVYLLPCAVALEKYGSRSNSGRWAQWHWKGGNPPGEAKPDLEILTLLGLEIQGKNHTVLPAPITNLNWPYFNYNPDDDELTKAEKCAMEINGYWLNPDGSIDTTTVNPSGLVTSFAALTNTGTTCSGNWLYCNQFVDPVNFDAFENANPGIWASTPGNRTARRYTPDVPNGGLSADPLYTGIGLHSYWSWCWPLNRRIIYNRASTYQSDGGSSGAGLAGDPIAPNKYVLRWDGAWKGDVPDHGGAPGAVYPFIMTKEGHGHLFGGWTVAEGPFPWHYEPTESPITYPAWLGAYRMNPTVHIYEGALFAQHGEITPTYPIFATSYRLTEHWHGGSMTRNLPRCNELQPEPFVEMSEELAAIKSIANGELIRATSARGSIEIKACVTKRFKPFRVNGTIVHQVGFIWHWGYMGLSTGPSANILTPFIGDANTRIPETKCFMVNIEKIT
ncbi:MAG: molybdopterin-dependent oxidoreductase [Nitrospirae bacterium]|nr:molybdopterin-dependent oxidoreductase [Nitrospirota bacterium]